MSRSYFVIPTLLRADCLEKCLASIAAYASDQCTVVIVNNWTHKGVASVIERFADSRSDGMEVLQFDHPENIGVAGAWNLGLKTCFAQGAQRVIVCNDDIELLEDSVAGLENALLAGNDFVWSALGGSFFAISAACFERVGTFDENFYPACYESEDYEYRMKLAGCKVVTAKQTYVIKHDQSATVGASALLRLQKQKTQQHNLLYYGRKWGGTPYHERFTKPFNDAKKKFDSWEPPTSRVGWNVKLVADVVVQDVTRPLSVRLYGCFATNGSFGRVSRGLEEGLTDLGILAGTVEADDVGEQEAPGMDALIGIYAGQPGFVATLTSHGMHEMNFAILAPNSSWLPDRVVEGMKRCAAIVAPSHWGAKVLAKYTGEFLPPLQHGVSKGFKPDAACGIELQRSYEAGEFRVLHLASTDKERKGTRELVSAWKALVTQEAIGKAPRLTIIVDAPPGTFPEAENAEPYISISYRRLGATVDQMAQVYQRFHLVCQPSRGEGFGLTPLEALACGVPVVATDCTGHAEYMPEPTWDPKNTAHEGCIVVRTGGDTPIDDGPGAEAPYLGEYEVACALRAAHECWEELFTNARERAPHVSAEWAWSKRIDKWLTEMNLKQL